MSKERVVEIREYEGRRPGGYGREAGFQVVTDRQTITLAIDDEASCCESWGYFLTEDDTEKFIGAGLRGVRITDTNRGTGQFFKGWDGYKEMDDERGDVSLDEGDVMFVDIETDRGNLQFVAYNAHNGYYGHEARVSSKQLEHSEYL